MHGFDKVVVVLVRIVLEMEEQTAVCQQDS